METIIVVDSDGVLIAAVGDGDELTFHSPDVKKVEIVKRAIKNHKKFSIVFGAPPVTAESHSLLGVFAALTAAAPNRTFLKEAPDELLDQISAL